MKLNLIHITDLHTTDKIIEDYNDFLLEKLSVQIKNEIDLKTLTLVLVTGDIVDKGGSSITTANNTNEALQYAYDQILLKLMKEINLPKENVFIVCGNHDINRKLDGHWGEKTIKDIEPYSAQYNQVIDSLYSGDDKIQGLKRINPYNVFATSIYKNYSLQKNITNLDNSFIVNNSNKTIGISCFNSSWRCFDDNDKGKLLIGEKQLRNSSKFIKDCNIKIALLHHPLDFINEKELNPIRTILNKDYDIIFYGHTHKSRSFSMQEKGNQAIQICSPSGFNNIRSKHIDYLSGYSIVTINSNSVKAKYYKYSRNQDEYVINTDEGKSGIDSFSLANKDSQLEIENAANEDIQYIHETNTQKKQIKKNLIHHCNQLFISDSKALLLSNHVNNTLHIWNTKNWSHVNYIKPSKGYVSAMNFENNYLKIFTNSGYCELYKDNNPFSAYKIINSEIIVSSTIIGEKLIAISKLNGKCKLIGNHTEDLPIPFNAIKIFSFNSNAYLVSDDGMIYKHRTDKNIYEPTKLEEISFDKKLSIYRIKNIEAKVSDFVFKGNKIIISNYTNKNVEVYDLNGRLCKTLIVKNNNEIAIT